MRTVILIVTVAVAGLVAAGAQAKARNATVGVVSSKDYRAVVTAHRASAGGAPTATVDVTTYARRGAAWRRLATKRLGGTYFWNTVTSPRAVCSLQLVTAGASPRVVVRLLVTPSIGCGHPTSVRLR
jgi:hypothetical protein